MSGSLRCGNGGSAFLLFKGSEIASPFGTGFFAVYKSDPSTAYRCFCFSRTLPGEEHRSVFFCLGCCYPVHGFNIYERSEKVIRIIVWELKIQMNQRFTAVFCNFINSGYSQRVVQVARLLSRTACADFYCNFLFIFMIPYSTTSPFLKCYLL